MTRNIKPTSSKQVSKKSQPGRNHSLNLRKFGKKSGGLHWSPKSPVVLAFAPNISRNERIDLQVELTKNRRKLRVIRTPAALVAAIQRDEYGAVLFTADGLGALSDGKLLHAIRVRKPRTLITVICPDGALSATRLKYASFVLDPLTPAAGIAATLTSVPKAEKAGFEAMPKPELGLTRSF